MCDEDLRFWRLCGDSRPAPGDERYTICGTTGSAAFYREYFGTIAVAAALHALCFACTFRERSDERKEA